MIYPAHEALRLGCCLREKNDEGSEELSSLCDYRCVCVCVCVDKNTPVEKKTLENISLKSTKSEAGEKFLLLFGRAKSGLKGYMCYYILYELLYYIITYCTVQNSAVQYSTVNTQRHETVTT